MSSQPTELSESGLISVGFVRGSDFITKISSVTIAAMKMIVATGSQSDANSLTLSENVARSTARSIGADPPLLECRRRF